jgi:hypothetical protein
LKIIVVKNNLPVGKLAENDEGTISFEYLENIKNNQYLIGLEESTNISTVTVASLKL